MMDGSELFEVLPLYYANLDCKKRFKVNQGGTSSGKTYSIIQLLFLKGILSPNKVITVVGQDIPNLKKGAYRDAKRIRDNSVGLHEWYPKVNEGDRLIQCVNGSIIEFASFADAQDAKSGKRDILFINEANGVSWEIFWQLNIRTKDEVYIDYNPSARFWVHENLIGREDVQLILSDHRKNTFLTEEQHETIERIKQEDVELWKVYARGATGSITGLVFPHFNVVDDLPPREEWKVSAWGLDWGFSCFKGDTLIMTSNGEKPIKNIERGDYVLTRKGYRKVLRKMYNGRKKVIHKKFAFNLQNTDIFCTFNHNFNANGIWKKYGELTEKDSLFLLSSSMAWSTEDTHKGNTLITTTTNGKRKGCIIPNCCIMQSLKRLTGLSRKVWLFITRTSTLLITKSAILLCSQILNICRYIVRWQSGLIAIKKNISVNCIQKTTGKSVGKRCLTNSKKNAGFANGVVMSSRLQTRTSDFAAQDVTTDGNIKHPKTTYRWYANIVGRLSMAISILNLRLAATNVRINYQKPTEINELGNEVCDVYDLWIDGVHEYFANGILVHNCDPTALVHLVLAHGEIWTDEVIYRTGMTNPDIAQAMKEAGLTGRDEIVADSAEPKSIAELNRMGYFIKPCKKGADSISNGIDILKRYTWNVTRRSAGLRKELLAYKWKTDRNGDMTNQPIDAFNHAIDAVRYAASETLGVRTQPRGVKVRR